LAPRPVWTCAKNLALTGIRSPDRPACSQSLYRLSYPAHNNSLYVYYRIFRPIARALSIQKRSEIIKNEHARYTLERFPTDNARVISTKKKKVSENTVLCIKHNFQLKLVCSIHSVALLNITLFKSKKFLIRTHQLSFRANVHKKSQGTVLQLTTDH
jgi:hypothetical protein